MLSIASGVPHKLEAFPDWLSHCLKYTIDKCWVSVHNAISNAISLVQAVWVIPVTFSGQPSSSLIVQLTCRTTLTYVFKQYFKLQKSQCVCQSAPELYKLILAHESRLIEIVA